MLKIVHFSQDFQEGKAQLGGFSRIYNLCSDGNEHFIFTISKSENQVKTWDLQAKIKVIAIPVYTAVFSRWEQIRMYPAIAKQIKAWLDGQAVKPDLIFGHSHIVNFYILQVLRKGYAVPPPLLWELNVIWGIHQSSSFLQKLLLWLIRKLQKDILQQATAVIVQTHSSGDFVVQYFGADPAKIHVVNNAVREEDVLPSLEERDGSSHHTYLCMGLFDTMNGIPMMLEVVKERGGMKNLHFYGKGLHLDAVISLARDNYSQYGGTITRKEMLEILRKFDFLIIPRLPLPEADLFIPTKLLEAMANGVIPVCSDVAGMEEVVIDGYNGFLFKAGDKNALISLLSELEKLPEDKKMKIRINAMKTIREKYLWEQQYKFLQSVYKGLLKQ